MSPLDSRKVEAGSLGRRSPPWPPAPRQRLRMRGETRELVYETSKGAARGIAQCQDRTQVDTPGGDDIFIVQRQAVLDRCRCYMKMSWGNCSVKVSCPHGDFHDEPEGIAPGGLDQSAARARAVRLRQAPERSGETWGKCPEKARSRSGHALVASWSCTGSFDEGVTLAERAIQTLGPIGRAVGDRIEGAS